MTHDEALTLISNVAKDMGKPLFVIENYGSGYFLDLPPAVARLATLYNDQVAINYVRQVFQRGHCEGAEHVGRIW